MTSRWGAVVLALLAFVLFIPALAGFGHLGARLLLEDPHRGQADDHGKQQHRQDGEGQDFGLQTQTHGSSLFSGNVKRLTAL
ncbi:MAG: hypothetical protein U1B84_13460 [Variovorax sp.]|nr:hypothetical protein [Variovorax sp.]